MKKALITGITGQDGSFLAELLLEKNYEVHGIIRRYSSFNTARIDHIYNDLHLHYGDLSDSSSISIDDIIFLFIINFSIYSLSLILQFTLSFAFLTLL